MPAGSLRRATRAINWVTVAPANCASSQMATSFRAPRSPSACGNKPSTTRPRPRLSALVSACRRVSGSGKRSSPTVPARKKKAPAETKSTVKMSSARLMRRPSLRVARVGTGGALHEGDRREGCEQRQHQRNIDHRRHFRSPPPAAAVRRRRRCRATAPPSCRSASAGPAQHADQSHRHHRQHEAGSGDQEVSHCRPARVRSPASGAPPPRPVRAGTGWPNIEAMHDAAPLSSDPAGTVPGSRLVSVQNASRAVPDGSRAGQPRSLVATAAADRARATPHPPRR